jgi:2,3-diketo-5-methylthio-1-phosphopentane phosphatase
MNNECDVRELNKRLCKSLPADLTFDEIKNFAIEQPIDPNFKKFVGFCKKNKFALTIVSDGYDAYIKPILEHHQLSDIPVFCNSLMQSKGIFYPKFFGAVEGCYCSTASCKRNVVLNNSSDEDISVYIGDGYTDFCGAEHSDIIFAKLKLAAYCNEKRIPHYPFKTFFDVFKILENNIKTKKNRQRHQAQMKRKDAFETE